jgi:hypothetical protein
MSSCNFLPRHSCSRRFPPPGPDTI